MLFNDYLPFNSLKKQTIDLFKIDMISKTIDSYKINCKCLLIMDNTASKLISKYMSLSEVINQGVFSVESIYRKRKPYKTYSAIYLISSAESSIKLVLEDFKGKKRLYKWCHLFILDKITNNIYELLLNKNFLRRIKTLKEVIMNYTPLDKNLFFFGIKGNYNSIYQLFANDEQKKILNMMNLSKICSICKVTGTYPNIVYFIHDSTCKFLADKINKKLSKYFKKLKIKKNGILLLTSRKMDLVGPIQFDLTYGHLLMELYKNLEKSEKNMAKVNFDGKEENIVFDYEDVLYNKYKVMSLYQIMTTINVDIEKFMKSDMGKIEKRNELDSLEEMGNAMKNITEYKYLNPLYNKHLKIVEDMNKKCLERNIMKIIDFQRTIISGVNYKGKKKGSNHISKRVLEYKNTFNKEDFLRLLCIIKYYNKESDIKSLIDIIESETIAINNIERQIINFFTPENSNINVELLKNLDKYIVLHRNKYKYNTQEDEDNKNDKRYLCVNESKITTICDMCCKDELPKDLFEYIEPPENISFCKYNVNTIVENVEENNQNMQNLILFNVGGLSNYEVSSIDKSNNIGQFGFNIIYGSNTIYNYKEYFNEIKDYFEGKNGITYEDEENPDDFFANDKNGNMGSDGEEEEIKENKKKKSKKKKKKRKFSRESIDADISEENKKEKDYIKIEMKNLDENKDEDEEEKLDKSTDIKNKRKKTKDEDEEDEKLEKSSDIKNKRKKVKYEDENLSSEEEKPKKKDKKKTVKKYEMEKINNDLKKSLNSFEDDENIDDYK